MGDEPFYPGFRYRDTQRETMAGAKYSADLLNSGEYARRSGFARDRHPNKEVLYSTCSVSTHVVLHCYTNCRTTTAVVYPDRGQRGGGGGGAVTVLLYRILASWNASNAPRAGVNTGRVDPATSIS